MDGPPMLEISRPRSASELVGTAFELYREMPLLFATLAAGVVIPYWLVILAITGAGPFTQRDLGLTAYLIVFVTQLSLVGPLISALHVHAVDDIDRGLVPTLGSIARRGLKVLPVVSAAAIAAAIGSYAGLLALVVPGVILYLRWAVVAQAAALEDGRWIDALKRSAQISNGNYLHVAGTELLVGVITGAFSFAFARAFAHHPTDLASFLIGLAVQTLTASFFALVVALLYFDLRSWLQFVDGRQVVSLGPNLPGPPDRPPAEPTGHPLDPYSYTDADRPHGWFIEPSHPRQMRYWSGDDRLGWTPDPKLTPKKTLADWQAYKTANPGPTPTPAGEADRRTVEPTGHPLDPDSYSDAERPPGWYVVAETPWKMRYWLGAEDGGWSGRTAKTPKQTLAGWWKISDR